MTTQLDTGHTLTQLASIMESVREAREPFLDNPSPLSTDTLIANMLGSVHADLRTVVDLIRSNHGQTTPSPTDQDRIHSTAELIAQMLLDDQPEGAMATRFGARAVIDEDQWGNLDMATISFLARTLVYRDALAVFTQARDRRYFFHSH